MWIMLVMCDVWTLMGAILLENTSMQLDYNSYRAFYTCIFWL